MKFGSFSIGGQAAWGGIADGEAIPLTSHWPSLKAAIVANALGEAAALCVTADRIPIAEISWLPLIPDPGKIICVGLNYEMHRRETSRAVVEHPTIFARFADSQAAHDAPLLIPAVSDKLDYEGELAVVIGRGGRSIPAHAALDHVAGYSCYNDGSVRDWQNHTIQFTPGKNFPQTGAFGPWLVPPSDFGELGLQRLQTRLNGAVMQDALIEQMIFPVATLIEYASTFTPLAPGDVIVSGTPGGVGAKREPPVFMREGDVVEVEIDRIGTLRNTIAREA